MLVDYKSRLSTIIQKFKNTEHYFAFADVNNGLTTIQNAVNGLKLSQESAVGTSNGTNTTFNVKNQPSLVTVNGIAQGEGIDYKYVNGKVLFKTPPASGAKVVSHYLSTGKPTTGASGGVSTGGGGGGGGTGTVTSVGLASPSEFIVSGSPVTSAGTLTFTKATELANSVWAGPTSGTGVPTFRPLVANDLPNSGIPTVHDESLTDGHGNFIFANGDIVTVVGVPN